MNPDGTVSETNTANILLINDRTITVPQSPSVLPGVTQQAVLDDLAGRGYTITKAPVSIKMCRAAGEIFLTNSLMGAVPVLHIDGQPAHTPTGLWREINVSLAIEIE
jgi:para-aminobenzoate synthetase component 1